MEDITYQMGCLVLVGPNSREVLAKVAYDDVSNEAFKFGTSREIYVGRTKCRVNRMNYVGELGFEIFHPIAHQITLYHDLMNANVAWTVKMDKEFIGKKGIEKQKKEGIARKLVCMVVDATDSDPFGYNPIFAGEERIGMTSSGGYGHRVEKSIALGYVKPEFAQTGTRLEVEILGRKRSAEVVAMPLYDPKNEKMKS